MKKTFTLAICMSFALFSMAQNTIQGSLQDGDSKPVEFANVVLYSQADSTLVKVETTNETGAFSLQGIADGSYYLEATSIGFDPLRKDGITLKDQSKLDLGSLKILSASIELETAVVTASRAIVEIKADKTIFNVQGTINSTGDNGLNLLRKAPGVLVDNNNNISVLSRSGVLLYVDGKRLPLNGDNLTNYLENLPAEQIDRIDIITNPGARYEAEGNAGIIDIRLKKDKSLGINGSISTTYGVGRFGTGNVGATGNYRNKSFNSFGTLGYGKGNRWNSMKFNSLQNGIFLSETNDMLNGFENYSYRWGTDFFMSKNHTIGFLISGTLNDGDNSADSRNRIFPAESAPLDSILIANNRSIRDQNGRTFNVNYTFNPGKTLLNVDVDYGRYRNNVDNFQPNRYYDESETILLTENITANATSVDIDIYTAKADLEKELFGGKLGLGAKFSKVVTDNTFLFYSIPDGERVINNQRSNQFTYDESVYAGYISFAKSLNEKWGMTAGVRIEQTDAVGDLRAYDVALQEPPVVLNYLNAFPTFGLSYQMAPEHSFNFNVGRRINRPDYNVLNPFEEQLNELSFSKGNPFLQPEIVNNAEIGYTLKYRYNFKLSYSHTTNQITRLIAPDDRDPRAGFITWDNLAEQDIWAANISAPVGITKWWNAFFNLSGSHINNQADYGDGAIVDVKAWTFNLFQQHTFELPGKWKGEVSGWLSGPGVWGGVFRYKTSGSFNLGLQRKLLKDQMTLRISGNDLFYTSGWRGVSEFDGLSSSGMGNYDSRRVSVSVSMNFGNNNVKSRKRKTGLEDEAKRVGS